MSTTPHPIAPEEIMALLDGELSPAVAQSVSAHMETCSDCRTLLQELHQTKFNVAMWQVASLPAAIETCIESAAANVSAPSATTSPGIFRRRRRWSRKHWMGGLAAAAAAAFLVLSFFSPSKHKPASVPVDFARVNLDREFKAPAAIGRQRRELAEKALPMAGPASVDQDGAFTDSVRSTNGFDQLEPGPLGKLQEQGRSIGQLKEQDSSYRGRLESGPMIARAVSLSIIAKDFDSSRASLDAIVARHNGYSANLAVSTPQGTARTLQASLRIPAPQLPAALVEIKALGRAEAENQNGEEVTQQHADLVARLKNSRETEQRLQAILTQRTGKISDVLEVEQEIARVRGEIEQMEAEQKNLEHRVDFATIDLKLSEEYKAKLDSPAPAISTLIHNAAVNGYRNVADTLLSIVLFFAEYGPVLFFWLLLFSIPAWLVWRRWRHAAAF